MLFIEDTLPTLLADVGSWVRTGAGTLTAEGKRRLCEVLQQYETKIRTVCIQNEQDAPHFRSRTHCISVRQELLGRQAHVSQMLGRFNDARSEYILESTSILVEQRFLGTDS